MEIAKSQGGKNLGTSSQPASDARSGLGMLRNPYTDLYSFLGVGLGRELSVFEIFDLASNPSLGVTTLS